MLFKITKPVLETKLESMKLSNRAINCMKRLQCVTVEDFIDNQYVVAKVKGCGVKTITEIKNKILELQIVEATKEM